MNILVTGATGFIGSHLVPELVKAGHKVTVFARKDSDTSVLPEDNIAVKQGSFSSQGDMANALRSVDTVIHLVGTWNTWGKSSRDIWSINVFPLQEIIRYAPKTLKQIVFLSSAHVYDLSRPSPISETSPTKPWNQYAASKLEAERILKESNRAYPRVFTPEYIQCAADQQESWNLLLALKNTSTVGVLETKDCASSTIAENHNVKINNLEIKPGLISFSAEAGKPSWIVINETYLPGWHAYINKGETEIYPANFLFQTIKIPPGINQITFEFRGINK